jgi:hypothetical protein
MEKQNMKNPRHKIGRPTVLTSELIKEIVGLLRGGCFVETAVATVGISKNTFYEWLRKAATLEKFQSDARAKGETFQAANDDLLLLDFQDAIKRASALAECDALKQIHRAGKAGHWQACAWFLERRWPQQWGRRICAEIAAPDEKPPSPVTEQIDLKKLTTEQLAQLEAILTSATINEAAPTTG